MVKESARLLPPVPIQMRQATVDTELAGYAVCKGSRVILSPLLSNRSPDLYPEPDRFLPELLWPPEKNLSQRARDTFAAEAHNRLSQPLYCFAFALIALAAVTRGTRQRGSRALRLTGASLAALGLYLAGFGVAGAAQSHPALVPAFYLIPLLGMLGAIAVLGGKSPAAILARRRARSHAA